MPARDAVRRSFSAQCGDFVAKQAQKGAVNATRSRYRAEKQHPRVLCTPARLRKYAAPGGSLSRRNEVTSSRNGRRKVL